MMNATLNNDRQYTVVRSMDKVLGADINPMLDFAARRNLLNGLVIGILKKGEMFVSTYGEEVKHDSTLEIGSVTKTFTAQLIDILAQQAKLSWNAPFASYLPTRLSRRQEIQEASKDISLLDLATHRAGLPLLPRNMKYLSPSNPYGLYDFSDIEEYLEQEFPRRPTRKRYSYSNISFALLGYIAQSVTQVSYSELLKRELLDPLNLTQTTLAMTGGNLQPVIQGYSETGIPTARWTQLAFAPTGGLCSTVGDQLKWIQYLLQDTERSVFQRCVVGRRRFMSPGWEYDSTFHLHKRDGMTGGFCSYISVNTNTHTGVVLLSNRKSIEVVRAIAGNIERSLLGLPHRAMRGNYGRTKARLIEQIRNNKMTYYLARNARKLFK